MLVTSNADTDGDQTDTTGDVHPERIDFNALFPDGKMPEGFDPMGDVPPGFDPAAMLSALTTWRPEGCEDGPFSEVTRWPHLLTICCCT